MNYKTLHTTIDGGRFKGKKLLLPSLATTRSTKSILKASYFNTIQFDIADAVFVEVFAGSGSMGLEAISRGAKRAIFIEKDALAYEVLRKNCDSFYDIDVVCIKGDAFCELPRASQTLKNAFFYFDPPFDTRDGMWQIYERSIELLQKIDKKAVRLAAFEHISTYKMPETINEFSLKKTKTFGKSSLSIYE